MSSLRPEQEIVQHFTHNHPLTKIDGFGGFICNGCNTYGYGKTYRCVSCNYDLHNYCATCPLTLLSFMHPQHELRLVFKRPDQTHQNRRRCNICLELAQGLFYQCEACGFDVHPLCTRLPQHVSHAPHPDHLLELSHLGASSTCMVCRGAIRSWRYKCGPCRFDIHMECVNSPASAAARGIQQMSFVPRPYHNHGCGCGSNQGQVDQASRPSIGRRMYGILMALTVGVVSNMIADPASEALAGWF